jgi:DNA polymerase-3 subunit epsilon
MVALDFETTGLDRERDQVVSFGAVPVREGRVMVGEAVQRLISPTVPASAASMRIHGLLPRDLADAPPLSAVRSELSDVLEGRFILAWFADVEIAFLSRVFPVPARRWIRRTIDVRLLALALEGAGRAARRTLSDTAVRYGVPVETPHDALEDALVTAELFLVLASRLEARGRVRMSDLLGLCRGAEARRRASPPT